MTVKIPLFPLDHFLTLKYDNQSLWNDHSKQGRMAWGMLAGRCRNVIVASVKQGEVKRQERAVLYLADYPHASSRLQGERADSLNRQEQAEHRPHNTWFAEIHTFSRFHSQTHRTQGSLSVALSNTHKQAFKTEFERSSGFPNHSDWKYCVDKHIFKRMQKNIIGRET